MGQRPSRARKDRRTLDLRSRSALVAIVLVALASVASAQGDTPPPAANIELLPAGSLVIAMDNDKQNVLTPFNLAAYGLVNDLLWADIPVKWIIRAGKAKDGIDFSATASRIAPTALPAAARDFRGGPFVVHRDYAAYALPRITAFARNVAVYQLTADVNADVRFTLTHKPKVATLDDGGNADIHQDILIAAGFTTPAHWIEISATSLATIGAASCLTFASEPHYDKSPPDSDAPAQGVRAFVEAGGNFLAQCAGVETYENNPTFGRYQTTLGIVVANSGDAHLYPNPDLPYSQFHGVLDDAGGSVRDWTLAAGSAWRPSSQFHVQNTPTTTRFQATVNKLAAGTGGLVHYLGGHEYGSGDVEELNGQRMYLNAVMTPALRPLGCALLVPQYTVSGTVYEDVNGDGAMGDGVGRPNVALRLYTDVNANGLIDAGDTFFSSTTTDAAGAWSFVVTPVVGNNLLVAVDSRGVTPSAGYNAPLTQADVWAEQTYGDNPSTGALDLAPRFGGRNAAISDAYNPASSTPADNTYEHVARIVMAGANVTGVNFGFSFNVVTTTRGGDATDDDAGAARTVQGSLRQFVQNANAVAGANSMRFVPASATNAAGGGGAWWRIAITTALPAVSDATTTIDGTAYSATDGVTVRDDNPGTLGAGGTVGVDALALPTLARAELELAGNSVLPLGLDLQAATATVRRVSIHGFGTAPGNDAHANVRVGNFGGATIRYNLIGAAPSSFADPGGTATGDGVRVVSGDAGTVRDNLVGFLDGNGVAFASGADGWTIEANEIRFNAAAITSGGGVVLGASTGATVRGNLIVDNRGAGIDTPSSGGSQTIVDNTVHGNGVGPAGALRHGIRLYGSDSSVDRNVVRQNFGAGVLVAPAALRNRITRNSFLDNGTVLDAGGGGPSGEIGIDLLSAGQSELAGTAPYVTPNDALDPDPGGNALTNFPLLNWALGNGGTTTVSGRLSASLPNTTYTLEFFSSPAGDPSGHGEGTTYLGSDSVTTDGSGNVSFVSVLPVMAAAGHVATATATDDVANTSEFSANVVVVDTLIDLSLTKVVDDPTPAVGSNVVFTLIVSNAGPMAATGVVVTDLLPAGYAWVSDDGGGAYDHTTGVWTVGAVAVSGSASLAITARVLGAGSWNNTAEVTAAAQLDQDSTPANGIGQGEDDEAAQATTPSDVVDLSLAKNASDATPDVGTNVVFTLDLSNAAGYSEATNVVVSDLLPAGYTFVSASGDGVYDDGAGTWTVASVPAGTTASIDITAHVLGAGAYDNVAEVTACDQPDEDDTYGDGAGEDWATQAMVPNAVVDLSLTKTVDDATPNVGTNVVFTLELANAATFSQATNVVVSDLLPTGYDFVSASGDGVYDDGAGTWTVASLAAGASASIDVTALVLGAGVHLNVAEVASADQPDTDDTYADGAGEDRATQATVPTPVVDLRLTKVVDEVSPNVGEDVVFTLTLQNAANFSPGTGIVVSDLLPTGYSFVSASGDGVYDGGAGTWSVAALAAGASASIDVTATVLGAGVYLNEAEVDFADQLEHDDTYGDGAGEDYDFAFTTPGAKVDLALTKSVDDATPAVGTNVVFTLILSNEVGFSLSTGVEVTDLLPTGYSFVSASGDGVYDDGTGAWTVAGLAAGTSVSIDITARVLGAGVYLNAAEVTYSDQPDVDDVFGNGAGEDYATQATVPTPVVDLDLTKSVDDATPAVGTNVVFTLELTNAATYSEATNVVVSDLLPTGYSFVSAAGDGVYDDGAGTWTVASLAAGATASIDITARVLGAGNYGNVAEVTAADQPDADDTYGDGAGDDYATQATVPTPVLDLSLTKSVDNATPAVGTNVVFTLELSNAATYSEATNVVVSDLLPTGYSFVSAAGDGVYDDGAGTWTVASLAAGASASIDITARVLGAGNYANVAEVTAADQPDADDTYADGAGEEYAAQATVPTPVVDLDLTKTVDDATPAVGTNVVFTLELTNAATYSEATNVVVSDLLPTGYSFVSAAGDGVYDDGAGTWTLASLAAGATASIDITARVLGAGNYGNVAEVTAADQPDADDTYGDGGGGDHATRATAPTPVVDFDLTKSVDDPTPAVGTNVVFTLELSNAATYSEATNVVVADLLPTGYSFVSAAGDGVYDDGAGIWTLVSLAAGATASIDITARVLGAGDYANVAEVDSADQPDADDTYGDGGGDDWATSVPVPEAVVDLSLTKAVDDATPAVGTNVVFTLELTNAATYSEATNVVVSDLLPTGYGFVSASGDGVYDDGAGTWTLGSLAAGASASIDVTARVLGAGVYLNVAEATSADQPDADDVYGNGAGEEYATQATVPTPVVDFDLTKTVDDATPAVGTNVVFTLELSNAATYSEATNVVVSDLLPTGYGFVSASGDGVYDDGAGTWTLATLAAGATASIDITARVLGAGNYGNIAEVTAADQPDADDTYGNGGGDDFATQATAPTAVVDLSLTKAVDDATPAVGTNVVFTLELTNAATYSEATNVVVSDLLPTGYSFVSAAGDGVYDDGAGTWTLGSLGAGATASIDVTARVLGAGNYVNVAEVTAADQPDADDVYGNGAGEDYATQATVPTPVLDLSLTKTVDDATPAVGTNVVFTLELSNAATYSEATNVVVSDLLPTGYSFVSAAGDGVYDDGAGTWTLGSLAAGASASIDITARVLGAGNYGNVAEVTAADQPDADDTFGDGAGEEYATQATAPTPAVDLALTKTVDDATPAVGTNVVFTLELSNAATYSAATNVVVSDLLPTGYSFVSAAGDGVYDDGAGTWTLASLAAGATASIDITARVLGAGVYANVAEVTAADQPDADDVYGNGAGEDWATSTPVPVSVVDLALTKAVDDATPAVGTNVVFTLELSNAPTYSEATNVVVSDLLPTGYSFVSAAGDGVYDDGAGTWTLGSLAAGATASIDVTARVLGAGNYANVAEVASADQPDADDVYGDGAGEDYATQATLPTPVLDLSLTKVVDDPTPAVGTNVVFTLELTNAATYSEATNVVVSDLLPAGYSFVSAAGDGVYDDGAGTWTVASLAAGATASIDITARVLGAGVYANVAEVTAADQPDVDDVYGDGAGEDWATSTPVPGATVDLALTKTVDDATPAVGTNVVFTLELTNAATYSEATNVVVSDLLPTGYSFVSAAGDGVYDDGAGTWTLASLAAGATASIDVTARLLGAGNYVNVAEVTAADQPDADDVYGNGAGEDYATQATVPTPVVDLALTKTVDVATPAVGTNVVFTLQLSNAATYSAATNVVVSDLLPTGYSFVSAFGDGVYDSGAGTWTLASLAAGATASIDVTARVLGAGNYGNVAEVASADQPDADDTYGDGAGEDYAAQATTPTPSVDLSLTKVVDDPTPAVGTNVVFTLELTNAATYSEATSVVVSDLLPTGYGFVSAAGDGVYDDGAGTWTLGSLAAGATASIDITARVLGAGNYANVAEVTSADQPDGDDTYGDGAGEDWATSTPVPGAVVDLALTKAVDDATPAVGTNVVFTLELSNAPTYSEATNVVVSDLLPTGYSFVSAAGDGVYDDGAGTWTLGSLAAGATASIDITARVLGTGSYINVAEVASADQPDTDDTYANGAGEDYATRSTVPTPVLDLALLKTVDDAAPAVGANVVFTLTLSNAATYSEATNVVVSDLLPTGYSFVSAAGDGIYDSGAGTWTLGSLAAGATASIDITARVLGAGNYANVAEVTSADQPDADDTYGDGAGEDWATSTPVPGATVDLALTKAVDVATPAVGTNVVFTLELTNAATYSEATNIVVSDLLPTGYSFVSATGDGVYDDGAGTWTLASLAAGATASIDITARVLGAGAYTNVAEVTVADQPDTDDTYGDGAGEDYAARATTPSAVVDLSLTKIVDQATPAVGSNVVFTLTLSNAATYSAATNVVVTDLLPAGYAFVSSAGDGVYDGGAGTWSVASVAAGASAQLQITARVLGAGSWVNVAEVTAADQPDADDTYGDGAGEDWATRTPVPGATVDLALTKIVDVPAPAVGTNVVFTLTLSNAAGYSPATNLVVSDLLPNGFGFLSAAGDGTYDAGAGTWSLPGLAPGTSAVLQITVRVLGTGSYANVAEVTAASEPDADDTYGDGAGEDWATSTPTPGAVVDLSLTKSVDDATPSVGADVVFTLTLTNAAGFSPATNVVVSDPLPAGFSFVSAAGAGAYDAPSGSWSVPPLAPGASAVLQITARVLGAGSWANVAEVTAADQPDTDDVYGDGAGEDHATSTPAPGATLDLSLTKTVDVPAPAVGTNVVFTLTLSNAAGFSPASNVVVTDLLPAGYAFVSSAGAGSYVAASGAWSVPALAPGASAVLQITARVLGTGSYVNVAEVTAADQPDIDDTYGDGAGEDRATSTPTPGARIDLALTKTIDDAAPVVGTNVVFTLELSNAAGFSDATSVVVSDPLPSGYAFVSSAGDGSYDALGGTWSLPVVAAGTTAQLQITARVLGSGAYLNVAEVTVADQLDADDTFGDGAGEDWASVDAAPGPRVDLSLTKTASNPTPPVQGSVDFTLVLSNEAGFSDALDVVVFDPLPAGLVFQSATGDGTYDETTGQWTIPAVPAGTSATLVITTQVLGTGGWTNVAEVVAARDLDADDVYGDGSGEDWARAVVIPAEVVDVRLTKTVDILRPEVGDEVTFTLTLSNEAGYTDATNVEVRDLLPSGYALVEARGDGGYDPGSGMWSVGIVPAGGQVDLVLRMRVLDGGNFTNEAEVHSADQPDVDDVYADGAGEDWAMAATEPFIDAVRLSKEASRAEAVAGDLVGYTVRVENRLAPPLIGVILTDLLPLGFQYVEGTARLALPGTDGVLGTSDDVVETLGVVAGRPMDIGPFDLAGLTTAEVSYLARVTTGVLPGTYANSVYPRTDLLTLGNTATTSVRVVLDPLFDLSTIIGKVFEDADGDELQGPGEAGVAGAMVALDDGTYALTDAEGRYHFPAVRPGQRLVKLNLRSLLPGSRATTDSRRLLWVTPGLMLRANFGVLVGAEETHIGKQPVPGAQIGARPRPQPIDVVGAVAAFRALVNGTEVALPRGNVELAIEALDPTIEVVGDSLAEPVLFELSVDAAEEVSAWALRVRDREDRIVRTIDGLDTPPRTLTWNARGDDGELLAGGSIYDYQLEVTYAGGARASSPRRMFGVNRSNVIAMTLTGDAFAVDEVTLSERAREALDEVAKLMERHPQEVVIIEGHTDSTGDDDYNLDLSRRRAESAADYLHDVRGLSRDRLVLRWYGEERPVATNELPEGMATNRRVEVKGQISETERSQIVDSYHAQARARVNGQELELGQHGRFSTQVDGATDRVALELRDGQGRSSEATVVLPRIEIAVPPVPPRVGDGVPSETCRADATAGDGGVRCRFVGRTDPGNVLELDGEPLDVAEDGTFAIELALVDGRNVHSFAARNAQGQLRLSNLEVEVARRDEQGREIRVGEVIPELHVQLPPDGTKLTSRTLRVAGRTLEGNVVTVNGKAVELGAEGGFEETLELPFGKSVVVVEVRDPEGHVGRVEREVAVPATQLFLVALADGKVSQLDGEGAIETAGLGTEDVDELFVEGRVAFYLKGVISGKYLITSSYDSARDEAEYLFQNLDAESGERLLHNLDPDRFYPIYGDQSTVVFDAETRGKFYLALESEQLTALVGSYPLALTGTELATYQRTLYGARVAWQSASSSPYGAPDTQVVVFAAELEQVHVSDELRATGGSLYYLSHRDVIEGSEQVTVVVRDKNSGLILDQRVQRQNLDYTIKYPEGRVMFHRPLASVQPGGSLVNEEILGGQPVYVLVEYETRLGGFDEVASGARVRQQVGDHVAVGATYVSDELQQGEYELGGVDAELRLRERTRIVAEFADSSGTDAQKYVSEDGGLTYVATAVTGEVEGQAFKGAIEIDLGEWFGKPDRHQVSVYFKELDPGFFSSGNFQEQGSRKTGLQGRFKLGEKDALLVRHDRAELSGGVSGPPPVGAAAESVITSAQWEHRAERWGANVEYFERATEDTLGTELEDQQLAAGRYWIKPLPKLTARIEHQQTLSGMDNDQTTLGAQYQVLEQLAVDVQATDGDRGSSAQLGALLGIGEAEIYLTERQVDDAASGERTSTILGARSPIGESSRVYSEYQIEDAESGDRAISLVGLQRQWDVAEGLRVQLAGELADVSAQAGDSRRSALSGGVTYGRDGLQAVTRNDLRWESGTTSRTQVLTFNQLDWQLSRDLTLLAKWRYSKTYDRDTDAREARFEERSLGLAYRPVDHDRFNALGRYTRLADLDPAVGSRGLRSDRTADVLSVDTALQATPRLEWLAKAAFRFQTERFATIPTQESESYLVIQRLNWKLYRTVDVGAEYRILGERRGDNQRDGFLAEVGWRLQRHVRLAVGYNFTDFSDNLLSANDYSVRGWYFRIQGLY